MDSRDKIWVVLIIAVFVFLTSSVITNCYENTTAIEAGLVQDSIQGKTMWVKPKETK